jgi:hypothetical protein
MKRTVWMVAGFAMAALMSSAAAQNDRAVKIAGHFEMLAGSQDNALALVEALRNGVPVQLIAPGAAAGRALPAVTTIDPPSGEMEWADVERALAMAQAALQRANIKRPTAEQLEAALLGGVITNAQGQSLIMAGILPLHAAGVPWNQVARLAVPRPQ